MRVELPSGRRVTGTVASVGRGRGDVDHPDGRDRRPDRVGRRRAWPIRGSATGSTARPSPWRSSATAPRNVLAVPVEALLALRGGGNAVEVVGSSGERTLVAVETGTFADGYVEVTGRGIEEGARVVVPA